MAFSTKPTAKEEVYERTLIFQVLTNVDLGRPMCSEKAAHSPRTLPHSSNFSTVMGTVCQCTSGFLMNVVDFTLEELRTMTSRRRSSSTGKLSTIAHMPQREVDQGGVNE